ncbi:hypothetical protein Tco_0471531 [Tanacetum coccineum]
MESGSYWLDKVWTSIWRDVRTLAIEEAYMTKYSIHPGADTVLCGFRLTNRWLSIKGLQDLDTMRLGVVNGSLLLIPLSSFRDYASGQVLLGRCSSFGKERHFRTERMSLDHLRSLDGLGIIRGPELTWERKDQMRSRELKRNGNVMVCDHLNEIGMVMKLVEFICSLFEVDKEMIIEI